MDCMLDSSSARMRHFEPLEKKPSRSHAAKTLRERVLKKKKQAPKSKKDYGKLFEYLDSLPVQSSAEPS